MPKGSIKAPGSKDTSAYRGAKAMFNGQNLAAKQLNERYAKAKMLKADTEKKPPKKKPKALSAY
jgi:hypothetical protein